jgi:alpha-L-fucosidase 2
MPAKGTPTMGRSLLLTLIFVVTGLHAESPDTPAADLNVDWPAFMAIQDPVWKRMPANYYEGPFVGNGLVGAILYRDEADTNALHVEIGRTDVYDHRPGNGLHYRCRLPIGHLLLKPSGNVTSSGFRTDLWNGEVTGTIVTSAGRITIRCFVPPDDPVIVIVWSVEGDEEKAGFSFVPEKGDSPRYLVTPGRDKGFVYDPNPPFEVSRREGTEVCVQPLKAGSDYATAWREERSGKSRTLLLSVANRGSSTGSAEDAIASVKAGFVKGVPSKAEANRSWWHAFYPASFVSVPDPRLESFYWIQLYKMASATRPGCPVVDLMGPWFRKSVWAAYWQNLNVQLAYYSVLPSNHPELGEPLCHLLWDRRADLIANVPEEYRSDSAALGRITGYGDLVSAAPGPAKQKQGSASYNFIALPWLMQQFEMQARFIGDNARLRDQVQPLLKRTVNTYLHLLDRDGNGTYHIPNSFSDEYGSAPDANLNLALLRWGLVTLLENDRRLGLHDPDAARWRDVLDHLADYPADPKDGLMIGAGVPFDKPHRHYSHLFSIFPLHVLNVDDQPDRRALMQRSIDHFLSLQGDDCLFKFTGASSLYAAIGDGDKALDSLNRALKPQSHGPTITANTLYSEGGWPTFESPISAQRCILDMLLQSWGGVIRVFPAFPSSWKDASFWRLRAEGGFLISAKREGGSTRFVAMESLAGEPCKILADLPEPVVVDGVPPQRLRRDEKGVLELDLKKGERAILHPAGIKPPFVIAPVTGSGEPKATWGLRDGS